ncbi:HsdM family class I SAM-dependent methyltransferase [Actinacidiphila glaucinigra]|nr:N-6 DNA methylase [Actinacidiphila glaucinigra]
MEGDEVRAPLVAFTEADQQDLSTSAIMASVADHEDEIRSLWLRAASSLATPAMLIALPDRLSLWNVGADENTTREIESVPIESSTLVIRTLSSLTPDSVNRAKLNLTQNPLFPVDLKLVEVSRKKSRSYLTAQVEAVMEMTASSIGGDPTGSVARIVIGALSALMLRDKGKVGYATPSVLTDVAQQRYPGYFEWLNGVDTNHLTAFDSAIREFDSRVNFAGLEPSTVSDVYEQALVTHSQRRVQGTYYTPPPIAQQILEMVPIETIAPQDRFILDPACGSGTMLLAASNRLRKLHPHSADALAKHQYVAKHVRGYDKDVFATEVAKLSLLMTDLSPGSSWRVEAKDALTAKLDESDRPSVIVCNPPWQHSRQGKPATERANEFISWMLASLTTNGFLACILPLSWINSATSRKARSSLLNEASLLEIWRLPGETFQSTTDAIAPAVVIAQKNPGGHRSGRPTLVKRISGRPGALSQFFETGRPDYAYLANPGRDGQGLLQGPLTRYFEKSTDFDILENVATVRNGRPHQPGRPKRRDTDTEATHWEISSLRHLIPFGSPIVEKLIPVKYPEDFSKSGKSDEFVRSPKLLVVAKRWNTANPWRIKTGIDLQGVVPRESFHMVLPNGSWHGWGTIPMGDRLFALLAILGSGLASCWVDERAPGRNIPPSVIQSLPVPKDPLHLRKLAAAAKGVRAAVEGGKESEVSTATIHLEKVVASVYHLPAEILDLLRKALGGLPGPEGVIRYPIQSGKIENNHSGREVPAFGHVIEANEDGLLIWVSGVTSDEGMRINPPIRASGWICQAGIDFQVSGDLKDLASAPMKLHKFDWLPDGEYGDPQATGAL